MSEIIQNGSLQIEQRTVDTPNTRARKIEEYMKRYEALQQERLRSFGRRASDDFGLEEVEIPTKTKEQDLPPFNSVSLPQNQSYEEQEEHHQLEQQEEEEDVFSMLPSTTLQVFPSSSSSLGSDQNISNSKESLIKNKEQQQQAFIDAEHFLDQQEEVEDSFLRELQDPTTGMHTAYTEDYTKTKSSTKLGFLSPLSSSSIASSSSRYFERPSDFFEKKSRNLDNIQFQSPPPLRGEATMMDDNNKLKAPTTPVTSSSINKKLSTFFPLSPVSSVLSQNEQDVSVHFALDRSVVTPTSLRRLQQKFELTKPMSPSRLPVLQVDEEVEEDVHALSKRVDEVVKSVHNLELPPSLKMALQMDAYTKKEPQKEPKEIEEEKELETIGVAVKKVREAMQEIERLTSLSYEESLYQAANAASKSRISLGSSWRLARSSFSPTASPTAGVAGAATATATTPSKPITTTATTATTPPPPVVITEVKEGVEEGGEVRYSPIAVAAKSKLTVDHFKSDRPSRNVTSEGHSVPYQQEQQPKGTIDDPTQYVTSQGPTAHPTLRSSYQTSFQHAHQQQQQVPARSASVSSSASSTKPSGHWDTTIQNNKSIHGRPSRNNNNLVVLETPPTTSVTTTSDHDGQRLCRRFFCVVGEKMVEKMEIYNKSKSIARICGSLLPITQGCSQFSMSPAVLELLPGQSGRFDICLKAQVPGVVAGIFQFRGVHVDALDPPFEMIIEAHVRRTHLIQQSDAQNQNQNQSQKKITTTTTTIQTIDEEEEESGKEESMDDNTEVEISPTFVRFRVSNGSGSSTMTTSQIGGVGGQNGGRIHREKVTLMNRSNKVKRFQIKSGHEHVLILPKEGTIQPFSTQLIKIRVLSQPFLKKKNKKSQNQNQSQNQIQQQQQWCGSFTIYMTSDTDSEESDIQQQQREISLVLDPNVLNLLPTFEEMARLQHQLALQTDSFYYSHQSNHKHPNRGLYFHAEAVECGQCPLGEAHQVCVYLCNGSDNPMTVFLQNLQEPFSCEYKTTTIKPKSYIPLPIIFRPKAKGKVSTSLTAYSLTTRASMTLIATGIISN